MDLLTALMSDFSHEEAIIEISEMRNRVHEGEDPEEVLYEYGLEPDYVFDLLEF